MTCYMAPKTQSPNREKPAPEFFSVQVQEARRFYLDLQPGHGRPLAVVCGGCERCAADYAIHRLRFPYYSIEFVVQGKGAVVLRGKEHALIPGRIFSYGPGVAHDITTDPVDRLVKYFVDFTGPNARRLLAASALAPGAIAQVTSPSEIQDIFEDLIRNGRKGTRFTSLICRKLLEYLGLKIAESLLPLGEAETPARFTYQFCRQHIQTNYLRLKSLAEIARECHVDPAYLCRLFQRYDHQTPYRLLLRLKMNRAAERLQSPGALVKQIADELGFCDAFHFSRTFKSVFGLSPESFRRLRRE